MHGLQPPAGSDAIAPDTTGLNFYRADPSLGDLLQLYLPGVLFRHIEPHLDRLGALAGDHLDQCARLADRHTPVLHHRDRFGRDEQWIEYHPAYRELERVAYGEFGIHALSHRKGIMGWPDTYPVTVSEVTGEERDRVYQKQARRYSGFAEYAEKTAGIRTIPVLALRRA